MGLDVQGFNLAAILGTLAAIVYSLRILVLLERRIARMESHIERVAIGILREEKTIEKQGKKILGRAIKKKKR